MNRKFSIAHFGGIAGLIGALAILFSVGAADSDHSSTSAAAAGKKAPKIQFDTNFFDFGKITSAEKLAGAFKFKNVGNDVLKLDPPQVSCDCTDAHLTSDTLAPGESGEVAYTIKMDHPVTGQRTINIHSNDPENPDVELAVQLDYTPLYEATPGTLQLTLPPGKNEAQGSFIIIRNDGKALDIERLETSEKWITAEFDPSFDPAAGKSPASLGRVIVTVHRPAAPPSLIKAQVEMWSGPEAEHPVKTVALTGKILPPPIHPP